MRTRLVLLAGLGLLAAATTIGLAGAGAVPAGEDDEALVRRGRELFVTGCASCHGAGGSGTDQGPTLVGVGAASADFQLTTGRMPDTDPDREPVSKPPAYEPDE